AVDDDEAVEAHPHPAEDAAGGAADGRAGLDLAFGEQHRCDRLAGVGGHRPAVEREGDLRPALERGVEGESAGTRHDPILTAHSSKRASGSPTSVSSTSIPRPGPAGADPIASAERGS